MLREDKEPLLKYLCMALPYGVFCEIYNSTCTIKEKLSFGGITHFADDSICVRPFLRPMSSMTEEEMEEYNGEFEKDRQDILKIGKELEKAYKNKNYKSVWQHPVVPMYRHIIWLLKNHFDFMGLIPKGLAIEVTEENNPYKE